MIKHPMQSIELDKHGTARFKCNQIVRFLLDTNIHTMNDLGAMPFTDEDRTQFAQLIGYSVSGAGDLSYFDTDILIEADIQVEKLVREKKK